MQTKQQYHVVLLSPTLAALGGRAATTQEVVHPCPTAATRDAALAACTIFQGEQTQPIWQAALSFRNKLSRLESWEHQLDFFQKPGHKATGRSIKGINFLGSYRPSGNDSILISAFPCAGEECRQHPQSHPLSKASLPQETQQELRSDTVISSGKVYTF